MGYAKKLTRKELELDGITEITKDGKVFRRGKEIKLNTNNCGYKTLSIYARDENDQIIKYLLTRKCTNAAGETYYRADYAFKYRTITLNRAMIAWFNGQIGEGQVADHISNDKTDNTLDNLQTLTPKENLSKDKPEGYQRKAVITKHKPSREALIQQLVETNAEYDNAKLFGDQIAAHKLRSKISYIKAKIRGLDEEDKK